MKIIKPGHTAFVYRGTCARCECEVECSKKEVKREIGAFGFEYFTIACPTPKCDKRINLEEYRVGQIIPPRGGSGLTPAVDQSARTAPAREQRPCSG